jgi:hypothetical protein
MSDQLNGIRLYARKKHHEAVDKIQEAINELKCNGQLITFASISELSGVSRSALYRSNEVRALINTIKENNNENFDIKDVYDEIVSIKKILKAVDAKVQQHDKLLKNR